MQSKLCPKQTQANDTTQEWHLCYVKDYLLPEIS